MRHLNSALGPHRYQDEEGAASTASRRGAVGADVDKNRVMYKLTSDTMDGVCASVREAHIQGDNEQVHQKDGV